MDFAQFWFQGQAGGGGYEIGNSLRFRGNQYLQKSATGGDYQKYTLSVWLKRAINSDSHSYIQAAGGSSGSHDGIGFHNGYWTLRAYETVSNSSTQQVFTQGVMRDPAAWYHVHITYDVTVPNADKVRISINGVDQTDPSQAKSNTGYYWSNNTLYVGRNPHDTSNDFEGYIAEYHWVVDSVVGVDQFGEYDDNGIWMPKKYTGTHGPNGFYLDFSDPANIGADRSGNGQNFTPYGFELANASSSLFDLMQDSPTSNFPVINDIFNQGVSSPGTQYYDANLRYRTDTLYRPVVSTSPIPESGKYYWEVIVGTPVNDTGIGVQTMDAYQYYWYLNGNKTIYFRNGQVWVEGVNIGTVGPSFTTNDVIGVALDCDARQIKWYKNNSLVYTANLATLRSLHSIVYQASEANQAEGVMNWGQRNFAYTPPSGFTPLATAEMGPTPIPDPTDHFDVVLAPGASILSDAEAKFGTGALIWIKDRVNSSKSQIRSPINTSNQARCPGNDWAPYSAPSGDSVAWVWNLGSSTPVTNNDGNVPTQVIANQAAGFSAVRFTGTGANDHNIGHGLTKVPDFWIQIGQPGTVYSDINVGHKDIGAYGYLSLNDQGGAVADTSVWNRDVSTDKYFNYGKYFTFDNWTYFWHAVPGYSAFGRYTGSTNSNFNTFINTGFRPKFAIIKRCDGPDSWLLIDTSRDLYNPMKTRLDADTETAERTNTSFVDFVSNGIKIRTNNAQVGGGADYIYAAWAEHPFGGSNVSPTTAR